MGSKRLNLFVILFVLGLMLASVLIITSRDTKLGLDLSGGTQLIYQGQPNAQNPEVDGEDIDRAIEIVRDRVDSLGVAEPEISRIGQDQLQVNLPEIQDTQRAIDQVGDTAQLYFYDFEPNVIPLDDETQLGDVTPSTVRFQTVPRLYDAVKAASEREPQCVQDLCTQDGPQLYLFNKTSKELVGGPADEEADLLELPEVEALAEDQREILTVPQGTIVVQDQQIEPESEGTPAPPPQYLLLRDTPALSGEDLRDPQQETDPTTGEPNVTFSFSEEGRRAFADITAEIATRGQGSLEQLDYAFAIVLDDEIVSRPIIDFNENPGGIDGRTGAQISGLGSIQEAQDLANLLRIGALPVELNLISQSTVSATLGQQALDEGLIAGLIGLALVLLFLVFYYRFLGVVAALGLLAYAGFFFALMKLIPITLTLPGMAGLILTIGVAADSNVVIFERIKEEIRGGHSTLSAITTGYRKGIATIIDANVITLLTAFILFGLATSGVKGFAFTLGVGTLVSLFTAVVFTRAILGILGRSSVLRSPAFLGAGEKHVRWHFDFAGASKWFFSVSGAILAIGAISFSTQQLNFGIDFESGTRIKAALDTDVGVDEVRESLATAGVEAPESTKIQEVTEPAFGDNVFQIQGKIAPDQTGVVQDQLEADFGLEGEDDGFDSQSVGPTFGAQVAKSAGFAILFSLILISAYVAFRFEAKYAIPVLIAVIHDILITAGIYSLVGGEVSSATVAAFLTILGYSLYDCVIVFDRIRENVPRLPRATFAQIANRSLSEVLTRSLITGLGTTVLILSILLFGGETLSDFAFAMMIGILSGTYSSIFIATPILIAWKEREASYRSRAARIKEVMGYVPAFPEDNIVQRVDDGKALDVGGEFEDEAIAPKAMTNPNELVHTDPDLAASKDEVDAELAQGSGGADGSVESKRRRDRQRRRKHGRNR